MNKVLEAIVKRRSVRVYEPAQVDGADIKTILEAGIWAPSGCNEQPWHFTVIQNKKIIDHINEVAKKKMACAKSAWVKKLGLSGEFHLFYEAPTVIVVSGNSRSRSAMIDCSAATENMLLAASSLGLGSCWIGLISFFFENRKETAKLKLPRGFKPFYAIALGKPPKKMKFEAPARNHDVISWLK
jgi:nitroreductase